jgi:hypothetical protein
LRAAVREFQQPVHAEMLFHQVAEEVQTPLAG